MAITIVSGYRRSGTSAMMQAMIAGLNDGVVVHSDDDPKVGNVASWSGYIPNPGPLLEVGRDAYMNAGFIRGLPENCCIKVFFDGLPTLPAGKYIVIFMDRDEAEIRASCARAEQHLRAIGIPRNVPVSSMFDIFRPYNRDDIDHVLGIMDQRKDVELIEVDYADLIADPEKVMKKIKYRISGKARLDMDIEKAVSVINPDYYRSRRSEIQKTGIKNFIAREWEKKVDNG